MLITRIFVNNNNIDNVFIHNTGNSKNGIYEYEVVDINDKRIVPEVIKHKRKLGYRKLLIKVMKLLEKYDIPEQNDNNVVYKLEKYMNRSL
jgi:hypothetical protein